MGHPYNTLYASTCSHRNIHNIRSVISTMLTTSTISVTISVISIPISIPISATSAISAIFAIPKISAFLPQVPVDLATKFLIYTPSLYFLTFFPYVISWLYYTVHVYSLIISTLLYIIITYTYSITLYCVKNLYSALPCSV